MKKNYNVQNMQKKPTTRKGLYTHSDAVSVPVKGSSLWQCDGPSDRQNGFHTHFAGQTARHHWHNDRVGDGDGVGMYK